MIPADPKKQIGLKGKTASSKCAYLKRPLCQAKQAKGQVAKKPCTAIDSKNEDGSQLERSSFRFHSIDSVWQKEARSRVGVQYQLPCRFGCALRHSPNSRQCNRCFQMATVFSVLSQWSSQGYKKAILQFELHSWTTCKRLQLSCWECM